jgi:hypothetical protein
LTRSPCKPVDQDHLRKFAATTLFVTHNAADPKNDRIFRQQQGVNMPSSNPRPDWGYRCIATLVIGIACWLSAMPFCQFIQRTTFNRYHLQTRSFAAWAIQAPVPAMYNFYNRYQIEPQPWDATLFSQPIVGTINHFPVRLLTFADNRPLMLPHTDRQMLTVRSEYRGQSLTTRWSVSTAQDRVYEVIDEVVK